MEIPSWILKMFDFICKFFNTIIKYTKLSSENDVLKSEKNILKDENNTFKDELEKAKEKILTLEKQIIGIHDIPLNFDKLTGTWVNKENDLRYCADCKTKNIISPLKDNKHGWSCPSCNKPFDDPDRPKPKRQQRPPSNWRVS